MLGDTQKSVPLHFHGISSQVAIPTLEGGNHSQEGEVGRKGEGRS